MPSASLRAFLGALKEVEQLGKASHPTLAPNDPESLNLARAVGRGQIVLLSSHFERYIYAVNEELVAYLNARQIVGNKIPPIIKLQHSALPIDDLSKTGWEHRSGKLATFVSEDAWLWSNAQAGALVHGRLLTWMKSPAPDNLIRYYRCWGVDDIFDEITRRPNTRRALWLGISGLVDLRNNIAHGDFSAQATQADVQNYIRFARQFCERADRRLATQVERSLRLQRPWP